MNVPSKGDSAAVERRRRRKKKKGKIQICPAPVYCGRTFQGADLMWEHQSWSSTGPWHQVKVISSLLMGLFTLDCGPLLFHNIAPSKPQKERTIWTHSDLIRSVYNKWEIHLSVFDGSLACAGWNDEKWEVKVRKVPPVLAALWFKEFLSSFFLSFCKHKSSSVVFIQFGFVMQFKCWQCCPTTTCLADF